MAEVWKSEASLSLLIKLSAWNSIEGTKAWNCLTFFLFVHFAISHFLSYVSQQGGKQEFRKIIFMTYLWIRQAMCCVKMDGRIGCWMSWKAKRANTQTSGNKLMKQYHALGGILLSHQTVSCGFVLGNKYREQKSFLTKRLRLSG